MADPLGEYHRKRDFQQTAEPAGVLRASNQPIYVVQRHDATNLHYDFRLEVNGVLKSWAVPKGLPAKPGERRLAVPTEDHPLEYATFSGKIPKGAYGAGTVEIWDSGTYRNLNEHEDGGSLSMEEALASGKVEFHLDGYKLSGNYALIRIVDENEDRWLLIKMKGDQSGGSE